MDDEYKPNSQPLLGLLAQPPPSPPPPQSIDSADAYICTADDNNLLLALAGVCTVNNKNCTLDEAVAHQIHRFLHRLHLLI
jgi:hypothetical protein